MSRLNWGLPGRTRYVVAAAAALVAMGQNASAAISAGPGGSGVRVGQSSLIDTYDYSDTWTSAADGGNSLRVFSARLADGGYVVENRYANPTRSFLQDLGTSDRRPNMSIARDQGNNGISSTTRSPYPTGGSGAGSSTGFTQQGAGQNQFFNYGISYLTEDTTGSPFRDEFIVQFDAVQAPGQVRISVGGSPGFSTPAVAGNGALVHSLAIGFNGDNAADTTRANKIALITYEPDPNFPGDVRQVETLLPNITTGLAGNRRWHNYAVRFDRPDNEIEIYLDEVSLGKVSLLSLPAVYQNFNIDAISVGAFMGSGTTATPFGDRIWTDNFQVGSVAVPEPMSFAFVGIGLAGAGLGRRGRRTTR